MEGPLKNFSFHPDPLTKGELKSYADMYNKSKYGHSILLDTVIS
jgi:uncharacterized protein CbrC (UPF0167 family)